MSLRKDQVDARMVHLLDQEAAADFRYFWLSFCDAKRTPGQQFLGVCIVRARGVMTSVQEAHRLGCNPGGEVQIHEIPIGVPFEPNDLGRLLTKSEAAAINARVLPA